MPHLPALLPPPWSMHRAHQSSPSLAGAPLACLLAFPCTHSASLCVHTAPGKLSSLTPCFPACSSFFLKPLAHTFPQSHTPYLIHPQRNPPSVDFLHRFRLFCGLLAIPGPVPLNSSVFPLAGSDLVFDRHRRPPVEQHSPGRNPIPRQAPNQFRCQAVPYFPTRGSHILLSLDSDVSSIASRLGLILIQISPQTESLRWLPRFVARLLSNWRDGPPSPLPLLQLPSCN